MAGSASRSRPEGSRAEHGDGAATGDTRSPASESTGTAKPLGPRSHWDREAYEVLGLHRLRGIIRYHPLPEAVHAAP